MMGAEESKKTDTSSQVGSCLSSVENDRFPNQCHKESDATAWTVLHQCSLDKWNEGQSDESGFPGVLLKCDGLVHKDCSFSFCISQQGIININKNASIFSFRKRSKFAKMAEHFEYNHIPAQMSSINHFHVKSVVCYCDSLVVLHLSHNTNSQFGLLDLQLNKFLGIFGKQSVEYQSDTIFGQLSPDKSRCLIRLPSVGSPRWYGYVRFSIFQLYDLDTKAMLKEFKINQDIFHFCFDPRFTQNRVAVANFVQRLDNSLALVHLDTWKAVAVNVQACETGLPWNPYLRDICYTRDGYFVVASVLEVNCFCRERKLRNHQPVRCNIYIYSGDTAETLHHIPFSRYVCTQHNCPVNYKPAFSACSSRMAYVQDMQSGTNVLQLVQVYKLPSALCLQSKCRVVILQNFPLDSIAHLPLPKTLIDYLLFKPEYD